ncbi:hypothetical protein KSF_051470 [Reticulibacter mediterranei]|uniref:Uncharacterized protein n=1 Tax=Reticulibacter mediterranei TaxID=2778369 RepID=A0A8J3IGK6_9CHLR|nr:hypothetical protein KSF_051470 [Reticulibacter mediterranei]
MQIAVTFASTTLRGVGPDAAFIVRHLKRWLHSSVRPSSPGSSILAESTV